MKAKPKAKDEIKLVIQELKENPYRRFNLAFSLMSIIPFLVFFYLLAVKLFTINIFLGHIGIIIFLALFISLCGFFFAYGIIKSILSRVIFYAVQAKHSDQLKSTFVAYVSHELKNPLAVMKLNLLNIRDGIIGQINEEQRRMLELCQGIIERMNRLISEFLDLHKIEAGMVEIKRELCNLKEILERQIKEFELVCSQRRITLTPQIEGQDLSLWADQGKIMQVVNNILGNAIKYSPENSQVNLKIYVADGFIRLECTDAGSGIPADKLEKVFNKFERLDASKEGTGLGLTIAKDIVEWHKGKIWAENAPGKGTKFIVILPRDLRHSRR